MTGEEELREHEQRVAELRDAYIRATTRRAELAESRSRKADRVAAFHAWREAGTAYFNAFDRRVVIGSRVGADHNPAWRTDCAETAADVLRNVCIHYAALFTACDLLGISADPYRPTHNAFAAVQRLVREADANAAQEIRDEFMRLRLPTRGFDTEETAKAGLLSGPGSSLWERIVATTGAVVVLATTLFLVVRNQPFADPSLVVFLRILLSLSIATLGAVIPGFLHVRLGWGRVAIRAGGALALFVITYFFTPKVLPLHPRAEPPVSSAKPSEDIDIVDVGFAAHPGEARAPRLDIKLANRGASPAFIKNVKITVKRTWQLPSYTTVGVVVPPSHEYVAHLKPTGAPYDVSLPVSHGLKPDEMDRFTIQLEETSWPTSNTIYQVDVEIVANGSNVTYRKQDLLFLVTQAGTAFPRRSDVEEMARAQRSLGRKVDPADIERTYVAAKVMITEASRVQGIKSQALQNLIQAAAVSDLG